jgi:carbamoyl-phosphate synthase small subunit
MAADARDDRNQPDWATGALVLADGTVFWARGVGAVGAAVGEVCFNTSITGYQEILTDPSYAGQIITFTFPHIGNVGTNAEDVETTTPAARGCILRADITNPANWRSTQHLDDWLRAMNAARRTAPSSTSPMTRLIPRR